MNTRNEIAFAASSKVLLTILLSALALAPNARAAVVNTLSDSGAGSLRQTITDLNGGGVPGSVTFSVNGTISLLSDLPAISNSVVILGPGTTLLTISGSNSFRLFQLAANTTNSIGGLTLANGYTANDNSGAAIYNLGYTIVTNCALVSNTVVGGFGGAVANFGTGILLATNCTFANNTVRGGNGSNPPSPSLGGAGGAGGGMGGAIYTEGAVLELVACNIQNNVAAGGNGGNDAGNSGSYCGGNGGFPNRGLAGCIGQSGTAGSFGGGGGGSGWWGGVAAAYGGAGGFGGGGGGGTVTYPGGSGGAYGGDGGPAGGGGAGAGLGGGIFARTGAVSVVNCTFAGNLATNGVAGSGGAPSGNGQGLGGAVFSLVPPAVTDSTFSDNVASTAAPNSFTPTTLVVTSVADSGAGTLRDLIGYANTNADANTIVFQQNLSGQTITLTSGELVLSNNVTIDASALPGGISISGNHSARGFEITAGSVVYLNALTLRDGQAPDGNGGGILNHGTLTLTACALTANVAGYGGGILNDAILTLSACTLAGNTATNLGGGIYNLSDALTINNSTLSTNSAVGDGGGLITYGKVALYGSTLSGNSAAAGGAIAAYYGGSPTLINCTVAGNSVNIYDGGGINIYLGTAALTNCTLAGNSAVRYGGGINNAGTLLLANTIVAANTGGINDNIAGTFSGANNLTNGTPLLAPLGDYGGPTQTMPPLPGSPAIDAGLDTGSLPATDQRGFARVVNGTVDIGAVEGVYNPAGPGTLTDVTKLGDGSVQFGFTNYSGMIYTVLASTNVAAPLNTWSNLGPAVEAPLGTFQFTDPQATNYPRRFYTVRTP